MLCDPRRQLRDGVQSDGGVFGNGLLQALQPHVRAVDSELRQWWQSSPDEVKLGRTLAGNGSVQRDFRKQVAKDSMVA